MALSSTLLEIFHFFKISTISEAPTVFSCSNLVPQSSVTGVHPLAHSVAPTFAIANRKHPLVARPLASDNFGLSTSQSLLSYRLRPGPVRFGSRQSLHCCL